MHSKDAENANLLEEETERIEAAGNFELERKFEGFAVVGDEGFEPPTHSV